MEWMDTFHCTLQSICSDMDFQSTEVQDLFRRFGIKLFSTGPYTPWPSRAEAAVRVFEATLHDLCAQSGTLPDLKQATVKELLRKAAAVRNSMVLYGGQTPLELVFGRQPRDIVTIKNRLLSN